MLAEGVPNKVSGIRGQLNHGSESGLIVGHKTNDHEANTFADLYVRFVCMGTFVEDLQEELASTRNR